MGETTPEALAKLFPSMAQPAAPAVRSDAPAHEKELAGVFTGSPELFAPKAPPQQPEADAELRTLFDHSPHLFPKGVAKGKVDEKAPGAKPDSKTQTKAGESQPLEPAALELKLPEDVDPKAPALVEFRKAAGEFGLDAPKAQKLFDMHRAALDAQQKAAVAMADGWLETAKSDDEVGGDQFEESRATVAALVKEFGTPATAEFLGGAAGDHPELLRLLTRTAKALREARGE